MLSRENRLSGKRDVQRVYQKGERRAGQFLLVRKLQSSQGHPRIAVVVSTSVSKKATERNRAKRILRAILRSLSLPPSDVVVSVKRLPTEKDWHTAFKRDLSQWFLPSSSK